MLRAEALTRKYGSFIAVNEVSFQIGAGEIVGLLGHNGAGKTTIMKMMTGYLEPSSGIISIDGDDVWANRATIQKQLGYLPENCPVYPDMTVMEYLDYVAVLRGVPRQKQTERLCYVLEKANLLSVAQKLISTLSRGYRQRLGVAQALLNSPRLIILDEPTNGLDPTQILEMRSLIQELAQTATVVLSTHILQEVNAVCSRVIIVNSGRVALDAAMNDIQLSSRLRIVTDSEPERSRSVFQHLGDIQIVQSERKGAQFDYIVDVGEQDALQASASVNRSLVESGCNVYAIHPVARDLETIFGEITAGTASADGEQKAQKTELGILDSSRALAGAAENGQDNGGRKESVTVAREAGGSNE